MKKICRMRYFIILAMLLTFTMIGVSALSLHYNTEKISNTTPVLFENWKIMFEDGSCKKIVLPANISADSNEKIILKNNITEEIAGQTIAFRSRNTDITVLLDDEKIYEYNQNTVKGFVKSSGNLWHFISVPKQYTQGSLSIEMSSPYKNLGGKVTEIVWGARSTCILNFMYSEWFHVLSGFALFIIGLVFLVFYYVLKHLKLQNTGVIYFSLATVLLSLHMIVISGMLQIFYGNAVVYYLISYAALYLSFIPFIVFLTRTVFVQHEKILKPIYAVCLFLYIVMIMLQFVGICDLAVFENAVLVINILILFLLVGLTLKDFSNKNAKGIEISVAFLSVLQIIFILIDYFNNSDKYVGLKDYGMIILFLVPACDYIYKSVHRYRQDLEEKMQLNNVAMQSLVESQSKMSREIENLGEARDAAVDMNNMKSVFLGNVAGKLLMPMNRIIGFNELILRDEISDTVTEMAGNIQSEANIMLALINNLVDYSKVENGELEIKPVAYHVETVLYDMSEIVSLGIIDKNIDFIVEFSPNIPRELLGDEIRLRQILSNILNNAIHYTDNGTIRFKVESSLTAADEVLLTITISDTGIGIEESQLHQLFENFLMFDATQLAEHKGTGLGLTVCKQLVSLMNGSIDVKSVVGEGSVFTIVIPQKIINGTPLVVAEKSEYKALIYETNMLQRMMIKKTCREIGVEADLINDEAEFKSLIVSKVYRTVIICEEEYLKHKEYLDSDVCAGIRTVVLVDVAGSVNMYENAELLQRPVQCMNLYDAISGNDIVKPIAANHVQKFIAPQAKVLIVDDNPSNIKICMAMLEPYKMQLTTSLSGRECIEILEEQPSFDLVLLDYSMPEMSGPQITSEIRELDDKYYKTLPIIAMSAQKTNGGKELYISEGFDDFIDKPFEAAYLEKILETYIPKDKLFHSEAALEVIV